MAHLSMHSLCSLSISFISVIFLVLDAAHDWTKYWICYICKCYYNIKGPLAGYKIINLIIYEK